jgi:alpha-tubulin suppressor-like RCC1 family protein
VGGPSQRFVARCRHRGWRLLPAIAALFAMAMTVTASAAPSGTLAWGFGGIGQLGDGALASSYVPVQVSGLGSGVTALSASGHHNLALLRSGAVVAWGANVLDELDGESPSACAFSFPCSAVPVEVAGLQGKRVTAVAASFYFSLALLSNGKVMAWGRNSYGELGDGPSGSSSCEGQPCEQSPVEVTGLEDVVAISANYWHALALLGNGKVMAWGRNSYGESGGTSTESCLASGVATYTEPQPCDTTPTEVAGLNGVVAISAGWEHSLALLSDGKVVGWGSNQYGQLGPGADDGSCDDPCSRTPVEVSGLAQPADGVVPTAIAAGAYKSTALLSNGTVWAWGSNEYGQLGDGSFAGPETCDHGAPCSRSPIEVKDLSGVTAISGSAAYSLALLADGRVKGWGAGDLGRLGNGSTANQDLPVTVSGLSEATIISSGFWHSLAYRPPRPEVTSLSPATGPAAGSAEVAIGGANFGEATAVSFGSVPATSFTVTSPTSITAIAPPATGKSVDVTVTTPEGTSRISGSDRFRYLAPTVTGLSPASGPKSGGTTVTVTGAGFAPGTGATSFKFGGAQAATVNCSSTTTCAVVAPSHAVGWIEVKAIVSGLAGAKNPPLDEFAYH